MNPTSQPTWHRLVDLAVDTFKVLARDRLRTGQPVTSDGWYDIAVETAERATPRRDVAILAVLSSRPALAARPLDDDGARSLGEAAFGLLRDALRDELVGRLHGLRQEVAAGAAPPPARARGDLRGAGHGSWDLYAPRLDEAFELHLETELEAETLEAIALDPRRLAAHAATFAREVLPEALDDALALIASSPELAGRPPAAAQTFEGCAARTLEQAVVERLAATARRLAGRGRAAPAA